MSNILLTKVPPDTEQSNLALVTAQVVILSEAKNLRLGRNETLRCAQGDKSLNSYTLTPCHFRG